MKIENLNDVYNVDGWKFTICDDGTTVFFEERGGVFYDEEHDPMPDPSLYAAARKLAKQFQEMGFEEAHASSSEKGWVEVYVN